MGLSHVRGARIDGARGDGYAGCAGVRRADRRGDRRGRRVDRGRDRGRIYRFGRAMVIVGLAEGIAIYGLVIAILLIGKV
jgi:hypothetical protein